MNQASGHLIFLKFIWLKLYAPEHLDRTLID